MELKIVSDPSEYFDEFTTLDLIVGLYNRFMSGPPTIPFTKNDIALSECLSTLRFSINEFSDSFLAYKPIKKDISDKYQS